MSGGLLQVDVAVVGGGPAGLAAAHAIMRARPSTRVAVLERADALRPRGAQFLIQPNGTAALAAISPALKDAVAAHHLDHQVIRRYSDAGELLTACENGEMTAALRARGEIVSLPWHVLQRELAEALPPGVLHTAHRFLRFEQTADGVVAEFEGPGGGVRRVAAALLLGADGSQSPVREQLLGDGPPEYLGTAIWRAVCRRPADWPVEHGWVAWGGAPGSGKPTVMTATLRDGRVVWQMFKRWPAEQLHVIGGGRRAYIQEPAATNGTSGAAAGAAQAADGAADGSDRRAAGAERLQRALDAVAGYPQVLLDAIAGTDPAAVTEHGQFCRDPEQCKEYARGRVGLLGDACHLGTPLLGLGCSLALEDAVELGRAVGEHGPTPAALQAYQAVRLPAAGEVHAASVGLYRDMMAGRLQQPFNEFQFCIDRGFADRSFAPLQPAAAEPAAAAAAAGAS